MRKAVVAGLFYPSEKEELIKEIEEKFSNKKFGPKKFEAMENVIGVIVPHAGYVYSGYVAAHAYSKLKNQNKTFVIIGPNHTGLGAFVAVSSEDYWETPLGKVKVDLDFAKSLVKNSKYAKFDNLAHSQEHSIEVQLPFLQYLFGNNFSIVPICVLDQEKDVAEDLAKSLLAVKKEFILIASSDFTHYEPKDSAEKKDSLLIKSIESLDLEDFYYTLRYHDITACGYGAIATLMSLTKILGGKIILLKHMTSGDITKDYGSVVGYASLISVRKWLEATFCAYNWKNRLKNV